MLPAKHRRDRRRRKGDLRALPQLSLRLESEADGRDPQPNEGNRQGLGAAGQVVSAHANSLHAGEAR